MKRSVMRKLICIAKAILQTVTNQVSEQVNIVEQEIKQQITGYLNEVLDGAWTGKGAEKFVACVTEEIVPNLSQISNSVSQINKNINAAVNIMDDADMAVRSKVGELADAIEQI